MGGGRKIASKNSAKPVGLCKSVNQRSTCNVGQYKIKKKTFVYDTGLPRSGHEMESDLDLSSFGAAEFQPADSFGFS